MTANNAMEVAQQFIAAFDNMAASLAKSGSLLLGAHAALWLAFKEAKQETDQTAYITRMCCILATTNEDRPRWRHSVIRLILYLSPFLACIAWYSNALASDDDQEVAFSPHQGAMELVIKAISEARKSIRVALYSFTSRPIAQALVDAHRHGIEVRAVLDKSNKTARYSSATFLANMGIPTRIDYEYAIMHSKYLVIDDDEVELGIQTPKNSSVGNPAESKGIQTSIFPGAFNRPSSRSFRIYLNSLGSR